jgi:methylmalonyl-CoA/ethylmalonyl-CoA epimerase
MARLHQVARHVEDLDRAVVFYRDVLGLSFIARFDPPGLAFFDLDGTRLLLEVSAPPGLLYLGVEDIEARSAELSSRGVDIVAGPELVHRDEDGTFGPAGSEEWMTFYNDSEGNLTAFVERKPG